MLTSSQLADLLGISIRELSKFVRDGMPKEGRNKFNENKVRDWLLENGHAKKAPPTVYQTRADIAAAIGVDVTTISRWQNDPSFPGRAGTAGQRDGYYPLSEIQQWLGQREDNTKKPSTRGELEELKVAMATMDVMERLGGVEDVEVVANYYARICARSKNRLLDFPDEIDANLPPDIDDDVRDDIRSRAEITVRKVCRELEELHRTDSDELTAPEAERRERELDE